jgi:predicted PurR-regulated permease PerM
MNERDPKRMAAPVETSWGSRSHVQALVLIAATAGGIYLCYRLALPFLPALAWALALAILFTPFHCWLESRLKHPSLAAAVSVLMVGLIVAVPSIFVGQRLVMESALVEAL